MLIHDNFSDFHGFMYSKEDELVFVFGSKNSSVQNSLIKSKSDIDEFAKGIANSFEDQTALSNWFNAHNSSRYDCYMESEFRPAYLAAFILFINKI